MADCYYSSGIGIGEEGELAAPAFRWIKFQPNTHYDCQCSGTTTASMDKSEVYAGIKELHNYLGTYVQIKYAIMIKDVDMLLDFFECFITELKMSSRFQFQFGDAVPPPTLLEVIVLLGKFSVGNIEPKDARAFPKLQQQVQKYQKKYANELSHYKKDPLLQTLIDDYLPTQPPASGFEEGTSHWVRGALRTQWEYVEERVFMIPADSDNNDRVKQLTLLLNSAATPSQKSELLFDIIHTQLDINKKPNTHLPLDVWCSCLENFLSLVMILKKNMNICVIPDLWLPYVSNETMKDTGYWGDIHVTGDLVAVLNRCFYEYYHILLCVDPDSEEYAQTLNSEGTLFSLSANLLDYLIPRGDHLQIGHCALLLMELVYYKEEEECRMLEESVVPLENLSMDGELVGLGLLRFLHSRIQGCMDLGTIVHSKLYLIYHLAMKGLFSDAMNLLLDTRLSDKIDIMDSSTLLHYNRAIAQLGLCAYRNGFISEAHSLLSQVYRRGKLEHVLAQGSSHTPLGDTDWTSILVKELAFEVDSQQIWNQIYGPMPYHMRINLEMLEAVNCS